MDNRLSASIAEKAAKLFLYVVFFAFAAFTLYPLIWLVINSFKYTAEFQINRLGWPEDFTFSNYPEAWRRGNFGLLIFNSVYYTVLTNFFVILFGLMAAFAFAKIKHKATPLLLGSFVIGILLTLQSILVPLFIASNAMGLYNTRLGILLPYIGIGLPIAVYLCHDYIKSIPNALIESARMDGAGFFAIFFLIICPIAKPVAVTLAILGVTGTWNEFMLINVLSSSEEIKSLPVGIYKFSGALASDYGKQFAALTIGMAPMLAFFLAFRKEIVKGAAAGAVKG